MESLSVPFTNRSWTSGYEATLTVHGVVYLEREGLVVESRAVENYFGVKPTRETGIRKVPIPWAEIQSLSYRPRLLAWGKLVLRTRSLRALERVHSARGSEATFAVARADRLTARELASSVELELAERRLRALDAPASHGSLPPG